MIDCGLVQEREFLARNWEPCPVPSDEVDALLVTHAHIDHIGLIPKFVADGFDGPIYATHPTAALADVMLKDSARIQAEDAKYKKRRHRKEGRHGPHPVVPLYSEDDVSKALRRFRGVNYREPTEVAPGIQATWHDAGHILGSASLEIVVREANHERTIIFSGDLGQHDKPLIHDPTYFRLADYVVMESTYGNRDHNDHGSIEEQLEEIANRTIAQGGNLVIPVFAVERAQEMMYFISRLAHQNRIPDVPIFLDSPMAYDATTIFRQFEDWLDDETRSLIAADEPPLHFPGLQLTRSAQESKAINHVKGPCIIMAPAGMCNAGRIKHHLKANIGRPESTILFVGFQANGTLGRRLVSGDKDVRIHGREYRVKAQIEQVFGLSGHADRQGLIRWLDHFEAPPRKVFLTHGEEDAAMAFQSVIEQRFVFDVSVPQYGKILELDDDGPSLVRAGESVARTLPRDVAGTVDTDAAPLEVRDPSQSIAQAPDLEIHDSGPSCLRDDRRIKTVVFSAKPYDRQFLEAAASPAEHELTFLEARLTQETCSLAAGYDAVCVFVNDQLDAEVLQTLAKLGVKVIALRCAGFNNVDLAVAQALGLKVVRVPAYSPHAVAEHAVALILTLNRNIHRAHARVRDGNFALGGLLGFDLFGRTVGVIGTGQIGTVFARIMSGFGCRLLGYDKFPNPTCRELGMDYVELPQLFSQSDIISLHCPLTPETHHLISSQTIVQMKDGVMIVNTSRGAVIDTRAVIHGLKSGKIGHLGLDVYEEEADVFFEDLSNEVIPDDTLSRLLTFPNVVVTGHQAFFTKDALRCIAETTLHNISDIEYRNTCQNEVRADQVRRP